MKMANIGVKMGNKRIAEATISMEKQRMTASEVKIMRMADEHGNLCTVI